MTDKLPPLPFGYGSNWLREKARDLRNGSEHTSVCRGCGDENVCWTGTDRELADFLMQLAEAYDR